MTRFPHDRFAKQFLADLLEPLGTVEINRMVSDEVREVDLYFIPFPDPKPLSLGLLGRLAEAPCLIEPFRNPVDPEGIRSCLIKQLVLVAQLQREAKRQRQSSPLLPQLWILTPTASESILKECRAELDLPTWGEGIYPLAPILGAALVVIHQLPRVPDSLWLRLLGRGRVQQQAIQELLTLPEEDPMRQNGVRALSNCRIMVDAQQEELAEAERELIMNLSPLFLDWEEKTRQRGIEIGEQRGIEIGEQRGIEIGEQRGIEIGEQRGRLEVARKMVAEGMAPAQISQFTGLSLKQIQLLQTEETGT